MAWFNRPEGFITKSFDASAPVEHNQWSSDLLPLPKSHEECCGWTGKGADGWDCETTYITESENRALWGDR